MSIRGSRGGQLELGAAPEQPDPAERRIFVGVTPRDGTLALLVEGLPAEERVPLFEGVRGALARDRGTPSARLLRAVGAGCRRLEAQALHRFELAALGLTALLLDESAVHLVQLLPSQAYVVEDGQVRAIPEVPMRGAARVGSERGRRWEVEIEVSRFGTRPGSAYVLCTAGLAERMTAARVLDAARRPAAEAAAALHAAGGAGGAPASEEVLVARLVDVAERPRARLFPIRERRVPRPLEPVGSVGRPAGPRIEEWGLRQGARPALLARYGDPLPAVGRRRRPRRGALWLLAPAGVAAVAAAAVFSWRGRQAPAPPLASPAPTASPAGAEAGTSVGATLLVATEPFTSLAVADGVPHVLDSASRIAQPGAAPASVSGAAPIVALAARETETLALDAARTVWRLSPAGEPARPLALRAASLWQRPRSIATYAGNLYVLDPGDDAPLLVVGGEDHHYPLAVPHA